MIWIKNAGNWFSISNELRECGREAGFLDSDDYSTGIVYLKGWVGFAVNENLPDEAIENGISEALGNQLGIENPIFAFDEASDHDDYDNKAEELDAYYEGAHPDDDNS